MALQLKSLLPAPTSQTRKPESVQPPLFNEGQVSPFGIRMINSEPERHVTWVRSGSQTLQIDCGLSYKLVTGADSRLNAPVATLISRQESDTYNIQRYRFYRKHGWPQPHFYTGQSRSYADQNLVVNPFFIKQLRLSHYSRYTCGYIIQVENFKYAHLLHLGKITQNILKACVNLTHLQIEAYYDPRILNHYQEENPYNYSLIVSDQGFLSNQQTAEFLGEILPRNPNLNRVLLGNIHPKYNRPTLALATIRRHLQERWIRIPSLVFAQDEFGCEA